MPKNYNTNTIQSPQNNRNNGLLPEIIQLNLLCIALVLVFLIFEKTNTNTILTTGIVFQYNTSRIVHLCTTTYQTTT